MRRLLWPVVALALMMAYPLLFSTPFQQRLGALILLYAIAASAWNIIGGYAGQVSVGHVVFFGCGAYASMAAYSHLGLPPLVGFVVDTRTGYCQHFAGAMALMLRLLGIPARVAAGFVPGHYHDGTWTVTDHDAHTWVEVWFRGYGWLAFDPTGTRLATVTSYPS